MARSNHSDVVLKLTGNEAAVGAGAAASKPGPRLNLSVTPHLLHVGEQRTIAIADLRSVRLSDPQTVQIDSVGQSRPLLIHFGSAEKARQLRAALVFFGQQSRGGLPSVTDWQQLLVAPYDRLDVLDKSIPSAAPSSMMVGGGLRGVPLRTAAAATGRPGGKWLLPAIITAALLVAGVTVFLITGSSARDSDLSGLSPEQLRRQADAAFEAADHAAAVDRYQALVNLGAAEAEQCRRLAQSLIALRRHNDAIEPLRQVVYLGHSENPQDVLLLASSYRQLRKHERALEVLRVGLQRNMNDLSLHLERVRVLQEMNNTSQALAASGVIHQMHPEHVENSLNYARLLEKAERRTDALMVYQQLMDKHGAEEAYLATIRLLGQMQEFDEAKALIAECRYRFPQRSDLRGDWRQVLAGMGVRVPPPPKEPEPEPEPQPVPEPPTAADGTVPMNPDGMVPMNPDGTPVSPDGTTPAVPEGTTPVIPDGTLPPAMPDGTLPDGTAPLPDGTVPAPDPAVPGAVVPGNEIPEAPEEPEQAGGEEEQPMQ